MVPSFTKSCDINQTGKILLKGPRKAKVSIRKNVYLQRQEVKKIMIFFYLSVVSYFFFIRKSKRYCYSDKLSLDYVTYKSIECPKGA